MSFPQFDVFRGLPDALIEPLVAKLPARSFGAGDVVLRENQENAQVYLIESGELTVWKGEPRTGNSVQLTTLTAGSCFGEMSAINGARATAWIVAATPATVRLLALENLPADGAVQKQVTLNLARTLVDRLTGATDSLKQKHESEVKALKVVASASAFLTRVLTALSFYMFSMPLVAYLTPLLPTNSLVSFFFITAFSWLVLDYMKGRADVVREHFHMTTERWGRQVWRGFLWAVPLMAVFVVIKVTIMLTHSGQYLFWDPTAAFPKGRPPGLWLWATFAAVYAILSFAQEFIRCAVQGTLDMVNPQETARKHWLSIFVADVVFTSMHMHLSGMFAVQAFIGGLFFGFVFWKERSYLAVAVAHSTVGVWAVFVVGVPK